MSGGFKAQLENLRQAGRQAQDVSVSADTIDVVEPLNRVGAALAGVSAAAIAEQFGAQLHTELRRWSNGNREWGHNVRAAADNYEKADSEVARRFATLREELKR